ncbi:hypothetical protein A500_19239 [Clostridium sartagoforme AAU1]|uniref:Phosphohistidine phosphatase n=1 Tax=Clostridium sartagoforme AAU1 TaxID=1202534 RepID=R9BSD5_9CLOT|nr:hypothetical protein [Clostridium sartagoforme]EOR19978.1 hypothetical protein A500_19239 [Clostridium sartagoforme AAU1]
MEKFFEQLTSYNILNNLLPGAIFCYLLKYSMNITLLDSDLIGNLFFYYFCGMVISRVGSVIIEPVLKKVKYVKFAEYKDFVKASKKDSKIEVLSESNNMYRTFIALFTILIITKIYYNLSQKFIILNSIWKVLILVILLILFLMSYRKQVNYIKKRVDINVND